MIFCCETHTDRALDDAVEETGTFPLFSVVIGEELSTVCNYCGEMAVYKIEE